MKKRGDPYERPSLYEEIDEMIELASLIGPMAELRALARNNELDDKKLGFQLPITVDEAVDVIDNYEEVLIENQPIDSSNCDYACQVRLDWLTAIWDRREFQTEYNDIEPKDQESIETINDKSAREELLYAICLNHRRRRVTVCFRGSVAKLDWATDFQIWMNSVPNPMGNRSCQHPSVMIHSSLSECLFRASFRGTKGPNGQVLSEYQEILQEKLIPILKKNVGYKLYVTGHSMGAALAVLFAFVASSEVDGMIPKPVTCVSIGGPHIGDQHFRDSHQLLERLGYLRHIRLSNHKDTVSIYPKISFRFNILDPYSHVGTLFEQVGVNVLLYGGSTEPEISYPKNSTSVSDELKRAWKQTLLYHFPFNPNDLNTWPMHMLSAYSRRTRRNKAKLEKLYLNNIYSDSDIVGDLALAFKTKL